MARKTKKIIIDHQTIADAVQKAGNRARAYLRDPAKAMKLLTAAARKAGDKTPADGPLADVWNYLQAFFRLVKAYIQKQYTDIPWQSIVRVTAAIIYFVMPADLIPDVIPVAGLMDDAAVIGFVIRSVRADLDAFLAWESQQTDTAN